MAEAEKKITVELKFNALVPEGWEEGDKFAEGVGDAIIDAIKEGFRSAAHMNSVNPDKVAVESFEIVDYTEEEV